MAWEKQRSSGFDLRLDCCMDVDYKSGACKVFGEMLTRGTEHWRSPNRILEVTIRKVYYPITKSVLREVFGPFGVVEQVHVLGGSDQVLAHVVFETKHEAADAFGELHGRYVYDDCCQLDINWGFPQVHDATLDLSCQDTSASLSSLSSVLFPSTGSATSTLDDIGSRQLPMETVMSVTHAKVSALVVCDDITYRDVDDELLMPVMSTIAEVAIALPDLGVAVPIAPSAVVAVGGGICITAQPIVVLDSISCGIIDKLQAPLTPAVDEEAITNTGAAAVVSLGINNTAVTVTIEVPVTCLTKCPSSDISAISSMHATETAPTSLPSFTLLGVPLQSFTPLNLTSLLLSSLEGTMVLWPLPVKRVGQEPWPPPKLLKVMRDGIDLRPTPWPSFYFAAGILASCRFHWLSKHPWPVSAQQKIKVQSSECMIITSVSTHARAELYLQWYMHMLVGELDLLLSYMSLWLSSWCWLLSGAAEPWILFAVIHVDQCTWLDCTLFSVIGFSKHLATVCLLKAELDRYTARSIESKHLPSLQILQFNRTILEISSVPTKLNILYHVVVAKFPPEIMHNVAQLRPTPWPSFSFSYYHSMDQFLQKVPSSYLQLLLVLIHQLGDEISVGLITYKHHLAVIPQTCPYSWTYTSNIVRHMSMFCILFLMHGDGLLVLSLSDLHAAWWHKEQWQPPTPKTMWRHDFLVHSAKLHHCNCLGLFSLLLPIMLASVLQLSMTWDPSEFISSAWGQADTQEGRNVRISYWATLWAGIG